MAHNNTGANTADGAVAALTAQPDAPVAVLEVDELHLAAVAAATRPVVIVLLGLVRDQRDRRSEVRAVAASIAAVLHAHPEAVIVANADDPMAGVGLRRCPSRGLVSASGRRNSRVRTCRQRGHGLRRGAHRQEWWCTCGLRRPHVDWIATGTPAASRHPGAAVNLPATSNVANAVTALAAATLLGVEAERAAAAMA